MAKNKPLVGTAIIGQSGGPSAVINASAYGVIKTALESEYITTVYGAFHGIVGVLNFVNAMMTSILSRRREFAVLQAVGMTKRQLKAMLVWEGMLYTLGSGLISGLISAAVNPLAGRLLEQGYWFYRYHYTIAPVLLAIPVFALLGYAIPTIMYPQAARQSVVERLREAEV